MSYGKTDRPCPSFRLYKGYDYLCGNCGWDLEDHDIEECEVCNFRESNIGYSSRCPACSAI